MAKWLAMLSALIVCGNANAQSVQRVVLVGDSLSSTTYYAGQWLGWQYDVHVLGIGSTTSGDGAGNGDGESVATKITNGDIISGDIVVLMYGTNDYRGQDGIPDTSIAAGVAQSVTNMLSMAAEVEAVPAVPLIVAPPPCNDGVVACIAYGSGGMLDRYDYLAALAPALETAATAGGFYFLNAWDLFDGLAQGVDTLLGAAPDSVHPNAAGRLLLWRAVNAKLVTITGTPSDAMRP